MAVSERAMVAAPPVPEGGPARVVVSGLEKSYGRRPAVRGVSFTLGCGVTALLGPNGSGKSSILRCLAGIQDWDRGSVAIDGQDVRDSPRRARALVGYMPERVAFPPEMRVRRYLHHAACMKGVPRPRRKSEVAGAMARADLEHVADRVINNLSKGYRQRVGLAQAILGDPPFLVLDEPMAGLDPINAWDVRDTLWDYGRSHAVLLSTHVLPEARVLSQQVLVLAQGQLLFDGSVVEAELSGSITRRWRVGVSGTTEAELHRAVRAAGARVVHTATNGPATSLVIDAEAPAMVDDLARAILARGWRLAHLEPMTDLIDAAFREAGLAPGSDRARKG